MLASARVIGAGEATHGTREHFRLKHRLLERLVTHHDLTVLAMEANFNDAEQIDAWLQTGRGTVDEAMKDGLFTVWKTEEVREVLLWMRAWNADPKHKKKLRFRGYDVQGVRASIEALRTYLRKVGPGAERELLEPLEAIDTMREAHLSGKPAADSATTRNAITRLASRIAEQRRAYVARSSTAEHVLAMQHARILEQARVLFTAKGVVERFTARDRAMAENVVWLSEQLGKGERMMVWAHNGHVQHDVSASVSGPSMGTRLHEHFGRDYLAAGFIADEGTYRAWRKTEERPVTIAHVKFGPHELGWAAEAFARVGVPMFAVDLRSAPRGPVRDWLFAPRLFYSAGWMSPGDRYQGDANVLGRMFDVAIFTRRTTSARQLPRAARAWRARPEARDARGHLRPRGSRT